MKYLKKYWPILCFIVAIAILCIGEYNKRNTKWVTFYGNDGKAIQDDYVVELEYQNAELLDVTAKYYEYITKPDGEDVSVQMIGEVDVMTLGEYSVVYRVEHNDMVTDLTVIYVVKDVTEPTIVLEEEDYVLLVGQEYEEPGFTATDICDGDLTDKVVITGEPNPYRDFVMTYTVSDSSGNTCEVERHVSVVVGDNQRVMYLTFDDGPTAYTERLLDVLDQYNVKATFFVTGQNLDYVDMIGEAYRRGHTIALHTYSHDYSIYSSAEDYYADLQKIQDIVVEQTGEEAKIVRFPGGTSNTTSRKYCEGIMTFLAKDLEEKGYKYCDWNVSSGDGGGAHDEATVLQNVMSFSAGIRKAIVLQHDTQGFSVDAVDDIILYARSQGYLLLPLTESSPMVHQGTNN